MLQKFRVAKYEVVLEAGKEGLNLPPYKGSTLRGGFGGAFQKLVCSQRDKTCKVCLLHGNCPYAYVFETAPHLGAEALRNYENVPRPFVLEPPLEKKTVYAPGESLRFNLLLFGKAVDYLAYFILVFRELGETGIGKGRKKYGLKEVAAVSPVDGRREVIFHGAELLVRNVDLSFKGADIAGMYRFMEEFGSGEQGRVTVGYQTMTRIKYKDSFAGRIEFHMLVRNLLRRLSSLAYFHHGWELELDFVRLIELAGGVRIVEDNTRWVDWERFSSRQDAKINMGGVVGQVVYEGDLEKFKPLLKLAELVHVGKGVVFGMGKVVVL